MRDDIVRNARESIAEFARVGGCVIELISPRASHIVQLLRGSGIQRGHHSGVHSGKRRQRHAKSKLRHTRPRGWKHLWYVGRLSRIHLRGHEWRGHVCDGAGCCHHTGSDRHGGRLSCDCQLPDTFSTERRSSTNERRTICIRAAVVLLEHLLLLLDQVPAHALRIESARHLVQRRTVVRSHQLCSHSVNVVLSHGPQWSSNGRCNVCPIRRH